MTFIKIYSNKDASNFIFLFGEKYKHNWVALSFFVKIKFQHYPSSCSSVVLTSSNAPEVVTSSLPSTQLIFCKGVSPYHLRFALTEIGINASLSRWISYYQKQNKLPLSQSGADLVRGPQGGRGGGICPPSNFPQKKNLCNILIKFLKNKNK